MRTLHLNGTIAEESWFDDDVTPQLFREELESGSGDITIATTRPETMLGDSAVCVHPEDERYAGLVGKKLILPIANREIPLIADRYVDREFGTGCLKVTPCHDPNDWNLGHAHNLEFIQVIDDNGNMMQDEALCGKYAGMSREDCRKAIVEELRENGHLVAEEPLSHSVGCCYRCKTVIEPYVSDQWFVALSKLAPRARAAVPSDIKIYPENWTKTYYNWLDNIRDWCISRQIWWGHRIPAWTCPDCGELIVSETDPTSCPKCGSVKLEQDPDVLDTWFSSALWPFSTMGWPEQTETLKKFYPTSVLVTGFDILFFWVARMIIMGQQFMGEVPFKEVYIHALVRDAQGRKMSKSLGNGIDPLEMAEKYGADALRFSLTSGIAPGSDTRYTDAKTESARNFINKLWNASRFVIMNINPDDKLEFPSKLNGADKWILARLNDVIKEVTINLNKFEIGLAAARLYDFTWTEYCDWYIEMSKPLLYSKDKKEHEHAVAMLTYTLTQILKLLHPFIPYITEEIYSKYAKKGSILMKEDWPTYNKKFNYRKDEKNFEGLRELVVAIRNLRAEMGVVPSKKLNAYIKATDENFMKKAYQYLDKLAGIGNVTFIEDKSEIAERCTAIVTHTAEVMIPMGDLVDIEKERERILKEIAGAEGEINKAKGLLSNQGFVAKAPQKLIDNEKEKLERAIDKLAKLKDKLAELN